MFESHLRQSIFMVSALGLIGCASTSYRTYPTLRHDAPRAFIGEVIGLRDTSIIIQRCRTVLPREFAVVEIAVSDWVIGRDADTIIVMSGGRIDMALKLASPLVEAVSDGVQQWYKAGDRLVATAFQRPQQGYYLGFVRFFNGAFNDSLQAVYRLKGADFKKLRSPDWKSSPTLEDLYALIDRSWEEDEMNLGEIVKDLRHFYTERRRWGLTRLVWRRKPWRGKWDPDRGIIP